jgi:hypothetical protein
MKESISLDDIMKHTKKQCPKLHLQDCDFDNWTINKTMIHAKQLNQQQPEHPLGMHVPKKAWTSQFMEFVHSGVN